MALGASQQQRASEPWRVRNLIDLYEEGGECGTADVNRTSNSSQATDLASAFAQPFRGFLLPCLDPSNPSCPTSCHNKLSNEQNSAVEHSHSKIAIRASTEGLAVCTARESPCSNTPRSAASSSLDSPLKIFQALQQPCSPSSDSSFIPSYQDLNCTRVAAFADVAAAPSLLASCKNGTFSPSPPASCLSSREPSPRGSVHRDQDDAYTIDHASCSSLHTPASEDAQKLPEAGWKLMTFAIVLSSDPAAASGTIKKLLDDGALWSLDTTHQPVLLMIAVLAMIDLLSFLANFRLSYILHLMPFKIPYILQPVVCISAAFWSAAFSVMASVAFTMLQLLIALVCMR